MSWSLWQSAMASFFSGTAGFAVSWLVQSSVLILAGLLIARLLARQGSAVQFVVYGTTLAAVLICPLLTSAASVAGLTRWSLAMPVSFVKSPEPVHDAAGFPRLEVSSDTSLTPLSQIERPVRRVRSTLQTPTAELSDSLEPRGDLVAPAADFPADGVISGIAVEASVIPVLPTTRVAVKPFPWGVTLAAIGSVIWLVVSLTLLIRLAVAWFRLAGIRQRAVLAESDTLQICSDLALRMGVAAPQVLHTPFLPSPCLAGVLRPTVLLPEADLQLSMRDILIHELAHLRRRDGLWNLMRKLATGLFWFQPLLWVLSHRLEMSAEEVCDDFVVEFGGDRAEYANRLVDVAEFSAVPMATAGVAMVSLRSMLAQRVARIMDTSRRLSTRTSRRLVTSTLLAGSALTLILGLLGATPHITAVQADEESPRAAQTGGFGGGGAVIQVTRNDSQEGASIDAAERPAEKPVGATRHALPGLISSPSLLPGNRRWQMYTKHAGSSAEGVSWSPDGRWLAMSQGQIVRLYDFQSGTPEFTLVLAGHEDTVKAVRFDATGTRLATSSLDGTVRLWDINGREQFVYRGHEDAVQDVSWHPAGDRLASAGLDGAVRIWSTDGQTIADLRDHEAPVNAVAWNPNGKLLASGCENKSIRYWTADGQPELMLEGHIGPVRSLAWNVDGSRLASCDFGIEASDNQQEDRSHIKVWDINGLAVSELQVDQPLHSVSWSPDGARIAVGSWRGIRLWNLDMPQAPLKFSTSLNGFIPVAWRPTGEFIAAGPMLFDTNGTPQPLLPMRNVPFYSAGLNRDGAVLGTGRDNGAFDLYSNDGAQIFHAPPQPGNPYSLTCSIGWNAAGTEVIPGTRYQAQLQRYDAQGGKLGTPITLPGDARSLEWSRDGRYVVAGGDRQLVTLVDLETSKVTQLGKQGHGITQVRFTPDQQQVCSAGFDGCIRFWSLDGQPLKVLEAISAPICSLAWANGGELLASGHQDNTIRLWSGSGELLTVIGGHGGHVESLEFSPDGSTLASGSRDHSVRLWQRDGTPVSVLQGHSGTVYGVQWSPDGKQLYSAAADGTLRCWNVDSKVAVWQTLLGEAGGYVSVDAQGRFKHGDEKVLESDFVFFAEDDQQRLTRRNWDQIRATIPQVATTAERNPPNAP